MALLGGKLFAGVLFAGTLFGVPDEALPSVPDTFNADDQVLIVAKYEKSPFAIGHVSDVIIIKQEY